MKDILNSKSKEIVAIFDEVTLWSAPFGRLLLENIPMQPKVIIVDIGFGTGFPLIELSQRFGEQSKIYGIDIWKEGVSRTKAKIAALEINNIEIIEKSASTINIGDSQVDLVTSNLGVNNFEEKEAVYAEINRILKTGGKLCITTNPVGTFKELYGLFGLILKEMNLKEELKCIEDSIERRKTERKIISELEGNRFKFIKSKSDTTTLRFVDGEALLNHSLIRIGFRAYWEEMVGIENQSTFFEKLILRINNIIEKEGEFRMTIPMLYVEFEKE